MGAQLPLFPKRILSAILVAAVSFAWASASAYGLRRGPPPLLVGYFSNSTIYSSPPFYVKHLVTSGSAARLDQINYSSASVKNGRCSLADPLADLLTPYNAVNSVSGFADDPKSAFHGYLHQIQELKRRYPRLKILISLEGNATDFAIDAQPQNRTAFVKSCVDQYLRGRFADGISEPGVFDGVDIDWESPQQEDAANFQELIKEFRRQMNEVRPGLRLAVAVDQSPATLPGTDFAAIAPLVDQFGIMNYDYAGPWSATTGLLAPLFPNVLQAHGASIQTSIAAYRAAGIPTRKLLMGLPFYGYGWTGVNSSNHGLFQAYHRALVAGLSRRPHASALGFRRAGLLDLRRRGLRSLQSQLWPAPGSGRSHDLGVERRHCRCRVAQHRLPLAPPSAFGTRLRPCFGSGARANNHRGARITGHG
jgi:chitinase